MHRHQTPSSVLFHNLVPSAKNSPVGGGGGNTGQQNIGAATAYHIFSGYDVSAQVEMHHFRLLLLDNMGRLGHAGGHGQELT